MTKTSLNNKITLVYSPKYSETPFVKNVGQNCQLLKSHQDTSNSILVNYQTSLPNQHNSSHFNF